MKRLARPARLLAAAAGLAVCAHAATYQWDVNGATAGLGGTGNWDTSALYWDLLGSGLDLGGDTTTNVTFTSADSAVFGGTAGTVTVTAGGVTVNSIRINSAGYGFTGGTITLAGAAPGFVVNADASVSAVIAGTAGLVKTGTATLTLTAQNSYTGPTVIRTGKLKLDYSAAGAPTTNILSGSSALTLEGGTLEILGATSGTSAQTVAGLTLNAGGSAISLNSNGGTATNLALGAITRNTGATINFSLPTAGAITTSATNDATGMLGTWASVGSGTSTNYATVSGGAIAAYTGATTATDATGLTDTTGTANYNLTAATGTVPATVSANTIRYTGGAGTTTLGATSFSVNGLMNAGTGLWTIGSNTLTIGANRELVVNTAAQDITISSLIVNNGANASSLVKTGAGTLTLSAQNTYTGGTVVNEGKLTLSGSTGGNTRLRGAITVNSGATLLITGGDNSTGLGYNGQVTGLTINGGTVTADTVSHIWNMGSGVTMTGGTLQSNNGVSTTSGSQLEWGNTALTTLASATTSTIGGRLNIRTDSNPTLTVTVADGAAATDLLFTAAVTGGSGASVTKAGAGLMAYSAANSYDGTTTVNAGTLALTGANGSILNSAVVVNSGGTLKLDNTGAANNANRLGDAKTITLSGGTLSFSHDGAAGVNFAETTGTVSALGGTITTSQAAVGQTSILTLGDFIGAANFTGTGLGVDDRNKILIASGVNNAMLGSFNTNGLALYNTTLGVVEATYTDVPFAGTIADGAVTNVRLIGGTSGNVLLGSTVTTINALLQNQTGATTVDVASKTLRFGAAGGVMLAAGKAALTLGTAANSGTLTAGGADNTAGTLTLANNDTTAVLTVNAVIANNGTGVIGVTTGGAGKVVLAGTNTFTGNLVLGAATTEFSGASQTIGGTITGAGALLKSNAATTLTLTGASNSFTGGITVSGGTLEITGAGRLASGTYAGSIVNNGTFRYASSANQTLSGAISGTGVFTKAGSSTLTLTSILGSSGVTNIDGGTLLLNYNAVGSFGSNRININNGSRLELTGGRIDFGNQTFNYDANGGGTIFVNSGLNWVAQGSWVFQTNGGTKNTLSGTGGLNMNGGNGITFNVARGTDATSDLDVTVATGIGNNSGPLTKNGAGILTLATTVNHTGTTALNAGTVVLSGAGTLGAITNTSGITLNAGATLTLANTSSANNTNRLRDIATVTMNGGTLNFTNNAGAVNYSETAGALTVASGSGTIAIAQAAAGQTATLTFASIARTGGTIDFTGASLGTAMDTRGEIRFTAAPTLTNGILGTWATVNGTDFATVTGANNSIVAYNGYADVTRRGASAATIADGSTTNVRLTEGTGSAFNILLGAATTTIHTLTQSASGGSSAATIDPAGQTLAVNSILVASGAGALTIGTGTNNGALKSAGIDLAIINNSAATTTVNSVITDGTGASTLTKGGSGTLVLTGANTFTGGISIGGTLEIGGAGTLGTAGSYAGAIANGGILKINTSANQTLTGVISGTGSLVKDGAGTLTLNTAQNTYTGGTFVNGGTLTIARAGGGTTALVGSVTINTGATVNATASNVFGWNNGFTGLIINGGTFNAGANDIHFFNDTAGIISMNMTGGTLTVGSTASMIKNAPITVVASANQAVINGAGILNIRDNTTQTFDVGNGAQDVDLLVSLRFGQSGGTGAVLKTGAGTMAFTGDNSYTGTTTINAGVIRIGHANGLGTAAAGTTVTSGSALEIYNGITVGAEALTLNGTGISNGGALRNISGTNSHSGAIALASATRINSDAGTLTLSGVISGANALTLGGAGTLTLTGNNTFTGGLTVESGTVILNGTNGNTMAGRGTLTIGSGATVIAGGHNQLGTVGASGYIAPLVINGGTFNAHQYNHINSITMTAGTLGVNAAGGAQVDGMDMRVFNSVNPTVTTNAASTTAVISSKMTLTNAATFTVADGAAATDLQVSGVIVGASSLTKSGAGVLSLTGANTYSGGTTISAGTLVTGNTAALGAGGVSLAGGTLQVGNGTVQTVTLAANQSIVTAAGASILKFNAITSSIALSGTGKYDFSAGSLTLDLNNAFNTVGTYNLITGGTGNVGAGSYGWAGADTTNFGFSFSNGQLFVTAIPEPSVYGLIGAGTLALAARVRRRRRVAK